MLPLGPAGRLLLELVRLVDTTLAAGSLNNARAATRENQRRRLLLGLTSEPDPELSSLWRSA